MINTPIDMRQINVSFLSKIGGKLKRDGENMPLMKSNACVRFSARKKIHAKTEREKVKTI